MDNTATFKTDAPKICKPEQWTGYKNPTWMKRDKDNVTVLFSAVERRKSYFLRAFFERNGYKYRDMGDHIKEDVRWGKEYGNRMECNPMYFTSGSFIRNLMEIHKNEGLTKEDVVEKFVFLGGGGQCGPCRYGMYPQEYMKAANDAGFKNFRIIVFGSDLGSDAQAKGAALKVDLKFKINFIISIILADLLHIAECTVRPYAEDKEAALKVLTEIEEDLFKAFCSKMFMFTLPKALKMAHKKIAAIPLKKKKLPLIFVTGEFFANLAHNEGNYNLRRFIMDEGCEVLPGSFTQRTIYDNWRRTQEALRGIKYASNKKELKFWKSSLRKQTLSTIIIKYLYNYFRKPFNLEAIGGHTELHDLDELAELGAPHYHPEIFGGEGNLEIGEAIYYADKVQGFISSKPFGCMPSSGVSDGVQSKIMSMYPNLNFLSIETSGDNEVNILSRVSMMLFKAKQKIAAENHSS